MLHDIFVVKRLGEIVNQSGFIYFAQPKNREKGGKSDW
jgi:hypothetical protein